MKLNLSVLFDEEFRKSLREAVLGEAKKLARAEVDLTVKKEVERLSQELSRVVSDQSSYRFRNMMYDVIKSMLTVSWNPASNEFRKMIDEAVQDRIRTTLEAPIKKVVDAAVNAAVKEKLKNKTVWEAEKQHDYIKTVVRQVLAEGFK